VKQLNYFLGNEKDLLKLLKRTRTRMTSCKSRFSPAAAHGKQTREKEKITRILAVLIFQFARIRFERSEVWGVGKNSTLRRHITTSRESTKRVIRWLVVTHWYQN